MNKRAFLPGILLGCLASLILVVTVWLLHDSIRRRKIRAASSSREMSLPAFLGRVKSGDLLLCSGALWMQTLTRSHITHVALVYQCPDTLAWFAWDTMRTRKGGATLTPLAEFLYECYESGIERERSGFAFGRNSVLWHCELGASMPHLQKAIASLRSTPYSIRLWKAFSSFVMPLGLPMPVLDSNEDHAETDGAMYCSQLIARTLMDAGALGTQRPCYSYTPDDFWISSALSWSPGFAPRTHEHARLLFPQGRLTRPFFEALVQQHAGAPPSDSAAQFLQLLRSRQLLDR